MTMRWLDADWLTFDTETTGVDPESDRIVSAALLRVPAGTNTPTRVWEWVADPGIDIPAEATAVNGWTNEAARKLGQPAGKVTGLIVKALAEQWTAEVPLVVANATYDLTLLAAEYRRHHGGHLKLTGYTLDPMVIDRQLDKYRPGSRKLDKLCTHYGVTLTEAHTAKADALAALLVTRALVERFPQISRRTLVELYAYQKAWRRDWAAHYQAWKRTDLRQNGASEAEVQAVVIKPDWPIVRRQPVGV